MNLQRSLDARMTRIGSCLFAMWSWELRMGSRANALPGGGCADIIKRNVMSDSVEVQKSKFREKGRLMSASEIERTLVRLAHEIV
jgi:hypothetical protein